MCRKASERCGARTQRRLDMRMVKRPVASAIVAVGCLVAIQVAKGWAQSPSPSETSPSEQTAPSGQTQSISDQKLDQMASAMKRVASVKEDYEQQLVAAPPSDQERIVKE